LWIGVLIGALRLDVPVCAHFLANLDWRVGLVLRLVFAEADGLARMMDFRSPSQIP
jgi:hypothetical protein